jgi:hypothetical protein
VSKPRKVSKRNKARECWVIWHKSSERPAMYIGTNCDVSRRKVLALLNYHLATMPDSKRDYVTIRHFREVRR